MFDDGNSSLFRLRAEVMGDSPGGVRVEKVEVAER